MVSSHLETELKKSVFSHCFRRGNDLQLFHSILMTPLKVDHEALKIYEGFGEGKSVSQALEENPKSKDLIRELYQRRLIVEEDFPEVEAYRKKAREFDPPGLNIMYILPTDNCNYRCGYCFIEESLDEDYEHSIMDIETLRKGVGFFAENLRTNSTPPTIIFYGGEPLLNSEVVLEGCKYVRERIPESIITIVTNGSKVTRPIAKSLAHHDVIASVSLDGPKNVHDLARIKKGNLGTFEETIKGYNLLKENGVETAISFTVGSHNVDKLQKNLQFLVENLDPTGIGMNFLLDTHHGNNTFETDIEHATEKAIEGFEYLREVGIYEDRMMRKINSFLNGRIHLRDCGAPGNQIVLGPNGDLGVCQAFLPSRKFYPFNVNRDSNFTYEQLTAEWRDRYPLEMDECIECEALGVCGGGCPYQAYVKTGSIHNLDERMCKHNKRFVEWALWDIHDSQLKKD